MEISQVEFDLIKTTIKDKNALIVNIQKDRDYYQELYYELLDKFDKLYNYLEFKGENPDIIIKNWWEK